MNDSLPADFRFDADVIVVGASAGGIDALLVLFSGLPAGFRVPVIAMVHMPEDRDSQLPQIFGARAALPVREAAPGSPVEPGVLYFPPSGYHLLVEPDRTFSLSCEEPVLFSRPSIDVLMESCCDVYAPRIAGFVLTGANADGAGGLACIRQRGGLAVVQSPEEAAHPAMPLAAQARAKPQFVLPLQGIRELLYRLGAPS